MSRQIATCRLPIGWTAANVGQLDSAAGEQSWSDGNGLTILASEKGFRLRFEGIGEADVDCAARKVVFAGQGRELPASTFEHLLHDQLVPRLRSHLGEWVIHAAAVRLFSGTVLMLGQSGRGKSTLSASLAACGFSLLGDDAVVIKITVEEVWAEPTYSSLRLLPDSVDALFGRSERTSPTAHYTSKVRVERAGEGSEGPGLPCRALFLLAPPDASCTDIRVTPLDPTRACIELLRESFSLDPCDTAQAARRMEQASRAAELVPAFELSYPRHYALLPEVGKAVIAAVEGLA